MTSSKCHIEVVKSSSEAADAASKLMSRSRKNAENAKFVNHLVSALNSVDVGKVFRVTEVPEGFQLKNLHAMFATRGIRRGQDVEYGFVEYTDDDGNESEVLSFLKLTDKEGLIKGETYDS